MVRFFVFVVFVAVIALCCKVMSYVTGRWHEVTSWGVNNFCVVVSAILIKFVVN